MFTSRSMGLMVSLALCAGLNTASAAQSQKQSLEERYSAAVRSCERDFRSRASSRDYQIGKTRAEVNAKHQSCLATVKNQYDIAVAQRARRQSGN